MRLAALVALILGIARATPYTENYGSVRARCDDDAIALMEVAIAMIPDDQTRLLFTLCWSDTTQNPDCEPYLDVINSYLYAYAIQCTRSKRT